MSRIGKKPIPLPDGVSISVDGTQVTVKGPKGELSRTFAEGVEIAQEDGTLYVNRPDDERQSRALHGLSRALLDNMVTGVSKGFEIRLELIGTGYSAEMAGNDLRLRLGFSHDIVVVAPPTVTLALERRPAPVTAVIVVSGPNKELVGQVAADIRKLRPPEPYKGKGIKYETEIVRRKAGKSKA